MTDFSSLQIKVNDLKAKVTQNSITPAYLGALLDDFITQMKAIDMTGMSDDVKTALNNSRTALQDAQSALTKAGGAETSANSALQNALSAIDKANDAVEAARNAMRAADEARAGSRDAMTAADEAKSTANTVAQLSADSNSTALRAERNSMGAVETAGIAAEDASRALLQANAAMEAVANMPASFPTFDGTFRASAGIDTTRAYLDGDIQAQGGKVCLEERANRFVYCLTGDDLEPESCDYLTEWPGSEVYNDEYGKARKDKVFRCGGSLYGKDPTETLERFCTEYSVNKAIDEVQSCVDGLSMTVSAQSSLLAALARGELVTLLERLGYDQDDIDEFMFANVQLNAGITVDEVRMSAERFELFKEDKIEVPFECPVVPRYWEPPQDEGNDDEATELLYDKDANGAWFLSCFKQDKVKYIPRCKGDDPMWFRQSGTTLLGVSLGMRYPQLRYVGGIELDVPQSSLIQGQESLLKSSIGLGSGTRPNRLTETVDFSNAYNLLGFGAWVNASANIKFNNCFNLRHIGHVMVDDATEMFNGSISMYDFRGLDITASPRKLTRLCPVDPDEGVPHETMLPESLKYIEDDDEWQGAFNGHRFKDTELNVPDGSGMDEATFEDCTVTIREEDVSGLYRIRNQSRFKWPSTCELRTDCFIDSFAGVHRLGSNFGLYVEVEAPNYISCKGADIKSRFDNIC